MAWPAIFTLLLQQIMVVADRAVAARLGTGNVSALNFSSNLVLVVQTLLVGALSTVALPELSRKIASHDWQAAKNAAVLILRYIYGLYIHPYRDCFVCPSRAACNPDL